jgi:uncharacterized Zn-binding protein involved in type VI secretion
MGQPAAKLGDKITGVDTHIIITPSGSPVAVPLPFNGTINGGLSPDVKVNGKPAATAGSTAMNVPVHIPPGGSFQKPPSNIGTIQTGSPTVRINGKMAARAGDTATTCNDPVDLPAGTVVATSNVMIG